MPNKIGVNDSCPCGSGKKYKKCCRLNKFVEVGPQNPEQQLWREMTKRMFADIKEPHCKICGDTDELRKIQTNKGEAIFCEYCYNVQMNM